jgi:ABC-type transporter Mla subunit MlaD
MDTEVITLEWLGRTLQRVLDRVNAFEQNIPLQLKGMSGQLRTLDAQLAAMDNRLGSVDAHLQLLDSRLDQQDLKFRRIDESLDAIGNLATQIAAGVSALRGKV